MLINQPGRQHRLQHIRADKYGHVQINQGKTKKDKAQITKAFVLKKLFCNFIQKIKQQNKRNGINRVTLPFAERFRKERGYGMQNKIIKRRMNTQSQIFNNVFIIKAMFRADGNITCKKIRRKALPE